MTSVGVGECVPGPTLTSHAPFACPGPLSHLLAPTVFSAPLLTLSSHLSRIPAPICMPLPPPMRLTRSCDCVHVVFVCHWVAHTRREGMGDCTYTGDTLYDHDIKISEPLSLRLSDYYACISGEGGDSLPSHPSLWAPRDFINLLIYLLSKTY